MVARGSVQPETQHRKGGMVQQMTSTGQLVPHLSISSSRDDQLVPSFAGVLAGYDNILHSCMSQTICDKKLIGTFEDFVMLFEEYNVAKENNQFVILC